MEFSQEEFDRVLAELLDESPASHLLSVAGIYEIVSEEFNNEVLQRLHQKDVVNQAREAGEGLVCSECGSDEIREQVWVGWKSGELFGQCGDDFYCPACDDICCSALTRNEFEEERANARPK